MNNNIKVIILHGILGFSGWHESVKKELELRGYTVYADLLPHPDHPSRKEWIKKGLNILNKIPDKENVIIIGHSLGATLALDLLELIDKQIMLFISVSGFFEDYNAELNSYYLKEKTINFKKVISNAKKRIVIYGDNDKFVPQSNLKRLAEKLRPQETIIVHGGGHLSKSNGFTEFPLLLDLVTENS